MFIEFGILNYSLLIPLIYPFLFQIRRYIHEDSKFFYELLMDFLGYSLGGLIYLFINYRMKKLTEKKDENVDIIFGELEEKKSIQSNERITRTTNNSYGTGSSSSLNENNVFTQIEKKELSKKKTIKHHDYKFLLILSLIYIIPLGLEAFTLSNKININFKAGSSLFYYILFYVLFSKLILKYKISNHHIFSLIIIIACIAILLTIFIIFGNEEDYSELILNSLFFIIITALFSLYNNLEKIYFNKYMDSLYHLMFVVGTVCSSILIIYELITIIIFGIKDTDYNGFIFQIIKNYKNYSFLYILLFIFDILIAFIWLWGVQLTVYWLTPCHYIISESLSQILTTIIYDSLKDYNLSIKIIIYIIYIIIVFSSLIYNEVILINICSLSKDTKKKILLREKNEEKNISLALLEDKVNLDNDK